MSFFLRKAFSFGPIRLNLSKGGLGVSAGVTGARVGLGPKGAYVAGGRHGMYYREYVKGGKFLSGKEGTVNGRQEVNTFVDTGLTYDVSLDLSKQKVLTEPSIPRASFSLLALSLVFLLIFLTGFGIVTLFLSIGFMGAYIFLYVNAENANKTFKAIVEKLENRDDISKVLDEVSAKKIYFHAKYWLHFNVYKTINLIYYEDPDFISAEDLQLTEKKLSLPSKDKKDIKVFVFSIFLNEVIQDHMISEEEEQHLVKLQQSLNLKDEDIAVEKKMIRAMIKLRDTIDSELQVIQTELKLKKGEECYYESEGRLLKEKRLRQYQKDRVIYREIGYDIDMEGKIFLTNQRIFILSDGSRSYSLNRLLDITISLEDNTIQLNLENRKSPLIFTMPDILTFAGMLHKLI
ncbi:MAG: DUF4236 domain-containing protein [Chitinophagaceae bacterium]|nr:MAG: DUF4236 domain-containing protein [Chitinophagaceae bacterium]